MKPLLYLASFDWRGAHPRLCYMNCNEFGHVVYKHERMLISYKYGVIQFTSLMNRLSFCDLRKSSVHGVP